MAQLDQVKQLFNKDDKEGLSTLFKVVIPGIYEMSFKSCEGLESEVEVIRHYDGGNLGAPRTARGVQKVSNLSFSQGTAAAGGANKTIYEWYADVCDSAKPLKKRELSIVLIDSSNRDIAEWRVFNAWPCRWMAPTLSKEMNQLTVEYISFAHEGIERKK